MFDCGVAGAAVIMETTYDVMCVKKGSTIIAALLGMKEQWAIDALLVVGRL